MSAEGLRTGLLSGHAWSGWWRGGNAAAGLFGAGEGGGLPSRVIHGGENDEREEEEEKGDIDVDFGSPSNEYHCNVCSSERHSQPITCFLTTSSDADGHLTCCWWKMRSPFWTVTLRFSYL